MAESALASSPPPVLPYAIRHCESSDEPAVLELVRGTFGEPAGGEKSTAFWRWKHAQSPFGPSYAVCAVDARSGAMAALRVLMNWSFHAPDGSGCRAVRAVDTATHPEHRRRGLFSKLTLHAIDELAREGVPFIFNTPNRNSLPGYLKMGWQVVVRWPLLVRPVRWQAAARALLRRRPPASDRQASGDGLVSWREFRARYGAAVGEVIAAHEQGRGAVGYRTRRDLEYLDWRYGAHPHLEYRVHTLARGGELEGFLVLRRAVGIAGLQALLVTELFLRRPSAVAGVRLLRGLIARRSCDYLAAHAASGTVERRALRLTGFLRAPGRGMTFVARPLNPVGLDPVHRRSWDLTLGELEIF